MRKTLVVLGYSSLPFPGKSDKGKSVVVGMTDNDFFPDPPVPLPEVQAKAEELEANFLKSRDGTKADTQAMYQSDLELSLQLDQLAAYVQGVANANPDQALEIIFSANMDAKDNLGGRQRVFTASPAGIEGEVELLVPSAGDAAYDWRYRETGGEWNFWKTTTFADTIITGLTPGMRYEFSYRVIIGQTTGPWSDPISLIVV